MKQEEDLSKEMLKDYYIKCSYTLNNNMEKAQWDPVTYFEMVNKSTESGLSPNLTRFSAMDYYKKYIKPDNIVLPKINRFNRHKRHKDIKLRESVDYIAKVNHKNSMSMSIDRRKLHKLPALFTIADSERANSKIKILKEIMKKKKPKKKEVLKSGNFRPSYFSIIRIGFINLTEETKDKYIVKYK